MQTVVRRKSFKKVIIAAAVVVAAACIDSGAAKATLEAVIRLSNGTA